MNHAFINCESWEVGLSRLLILRYNKLLILRYNQLLTLPAVLFFAKRICRSKLVLVEGKSCFFELYFTMFILRRLKSPDTVGKEYGARRKCGSVLCRML